MRMEFNQFRIMQVHVDNLDLCNDCKNIEKCPLICTLEDDLAVLRHERIKISECGLYKKRGHNQ